MSSITEASVLPAPASRSGAFRALGMIVVAPAETARRLAVERYWVLALLVAAVVSFVTTSVNISRVDIATEMRERLAAQDPHATEEDLRTGVEMARGLAKLGGFMSGAITPVTILVIAGVLLAAHMGAGGTARFSQALSATTHAWVPQSIKSILVMSLMLSTKHVKASTAQTILRSNLGFLAGTGHRTAFTLLSAIDVFDFWTIGLLAAGFAAASRVSFRRSLLVISGTYAAVVGVRVVLAMTLVHTP